MKDEKDILSPTKCTFPMKRNMITLIEKMVNDVISILGINPLCFSAEELNIYESNSVEDEIFSTPQAIRACYITIRPDILCGAVMDAVTHAVDCCHGELMKRQGGHLRAGLGDIGVDAQLCTRRTRECERVLVVRIILLEEPDGSLDDSEAEEEDWIVEATNYWLAEKKGDEKTANIWPLKMLSPKKGQDKERNNLFPCLSDDYAQLVKKSWKMIVDIIQELETRDLAYCTITTAPFGAFPSLPTLDAHYVAQLRHLSRENMITSLLKTARDLESFALENEHKCNNLTKLLHVAFNSYDIEPPILPEKKPLSAYPLKYDPPDELHPPWGKRVQSALEKISNSSFKASDAVRLVNSAFQRQDDEEMTARLSRKNSQVMERLHQVQEYKRGLLATLRLAYGRFPRATRAAKEFLSITKRINNTADVRDCIPLLTTSVLLATPKSGYTNTTATCVVTSDQIFINIPSIPLLGFLSHAKHFLFSTHDDIQVWEMDKKFHGRLYIGDGMNPDGVRICVNGEERMSFVPEVGAKRFKLFVEMVLEGTKSCDKEDGDVFEEGEDVATFKSQVNTMPMDDFSLALMM
mmetsp:Transcript_56759/g.67994  ORF Transcript_56759/g.67994 Transcript_56759/m.67994 type:complete len:579 (+) Transcript_56759:220-1956(+)